MSESYRVRFGLPEQAVNYDAVEYAGGRYPQILWEIEKRILSDELLRLKATTPTVDHLDFACGTGRVMAFLEPDVRVSTGIDISASMLDVARSKVKRAQLICADITTDKSSIEGRYDLITCFRFFLNAEPLLRSAAASALAVRLRDRNSRLIISNHGNLSSYRILAWPFAKLSERLGRAFPRRFLSYTEMDTLLGSAGLEIIATHGYAQLSRAALELLSADSVKRLEWRLTDFPVLRWIGASQLYIVRLRDG